MIISNEIIKIFKESPLFLPKTPKFNRPFKILITNAGKWGWKSDINGYGYVTKHPITKKMASNPEIIFRNLEELLW